MRFRFDIVKHRNKYFAVSIIITLIGIISLSLFGLNYGIDFKSGTTLDVSTGKVMSNEKVVAIIQDQMADSKYTKTFSGDQKRVTLRFDQILTESQSESIVAAFATEYGDDVTYEENTVDVTMAKELARNAIYAMIFANIGIIIYIALRFEWRFGLAAVIGQVHDALIVITVFSIFRFEVNLPFVAAVLTIIGYSTNDTIIIFDRIRENLRFAKTKAFADLEKLVNDSIWQVMRRSINTVITVLVAAVCLFIFGSASIKLFSLAMIVGLISGAYSSIFISAQLWLLLKRNTLNKKKVAVIKE